MGWSTTDWTPGNIQQYANEFWEAIKERKIIMGQDVSSFHIPTAGAQIQAASVSAPTSPTGTFSFRWLQDWLFDWANIGMFRRSHDANGDPIPAPTDGDELYAVTNWGPYSLLASVSGIPAKNQFRRATTWPTDWTDWNDPAYSLGKIELYSPWQTGDILGPWIPADIQSAINKLVWRLGSRRWTNNGENNRWEGQTSYYREGRDWDEAKAEAEADYQEVGSQGNYFECYSAGARWYVPRNTGYDAKLKRSWGWLEVYDMPDDFAREVDWGFPALMYQSDDWSGYPMWDANGDAVVEGNNWLGTTVHAASSGTSYMWPTAVGNNVTPEDYPNWLPGNPNVDPWIHTRGYGVYTARTLIRWNVAGGLTYIAD